MTILSVAFVGMLVFLVPHLFDEAEATATTKSRAFAPQGTTFSLDYSYLGYGRWIQFPTLTDGGAQMTWMLGNNEPNPSREKATITASVWESGNKIGTVQFTTARDHRVGVECSPRVLFGPLQVTCNVIDGIDATVTFQVSKSLGSGSSNGLCDILSKFDGFEQTKIIREKLHC